jgi:acylphosphatase
MMLPRMIVARRYVIAGRVQGVGFRYFTEAAAAREGILGWVRNTPDGRVEILAEGDTSAVERFERSLRHGPPHARVERVDVDETIPTGMETGFAIK